MLSAGAKLQAVCGGFVGVHAAPVFWMTTMNRFSSPGAWFELWHPQRWPGAYTTYNQGRVAGIPRRWDEEDRTATHNEFDITV